MKVSRLHCVSLFAICTQLGACSAPVETSEQHLAQTDGASYEVDGNSEEPGTSNGVTIGDPADADSDSAFAGCADPCAEPTPCGQICLTLKGVGSSCTLGPTANDLTRPPRGVRFDCNEIARGPNGYDFDALGHITLMGDTCAALTKSGPHRVALMLSCQP